MPRPRPVPFEIRDATPSDLPSLARMGARLSRWYHRLDPARFFLPEEPLEEGYAWWLGKERRSRNAVVLAAVRRGRVVGYAYGRIEARDWSSLRDRCGVGVDIFVLPSARRAGVGRALVDALVARLAARGAPRVVIGVAVRNRRGVKVFEGLGFRPTMLELTREIDAPSRRRKRS
jgi:ribosomal protein S18 acetylase RimI-like enzyme